MYSFKELRKASKTEMQGKEMKVAVLGNCATQFVSLSISGYAKLSGINANVYDADYNQIDAQLLDPSSEVYAFGPDVILLWLASDKLYEEFLDSSMESRPHFAELYIQKIRSYWSYIANNCKAKIIQFNFSELSDNILGNLSSKTDSSFIYQIRKLNFMLQEEMRDNPNVFPLDLLSIQVQLGESVFYDAAFYYKAKMSVSTNALPYIAKSVVDILNSMNGKIKKCVILDLDNTLWGGIIGDDGMNNIEIGELGRGHVFTNLQRWLKELKDYGIILAVCSKNNEDIAKEPFEKHPDMVLRLEDISVFVANWNDKASNIQLIQSVLNIGMDSIIFVDDNPFERNLVRQMIPAIEVPELPEDPAEYLSYLQQCNYFDTVAYSASSSDRTKQYQAEFERKKLESSFASIDDYLINLEMIGEAKAFEEAKFSRIAELSQRSNQFNLRTIRYTEEDIRRMAQDPSCVTLYYTVRDKFGDHGLIGATIMKEISPEELFIDTWYMSCRVLKRGVEEFIVNKMVSEAAARGYKYISAEYIPTAKNKMVSEIYPQFGFTTTAENHYRIRVEDYKEKTCHIKELN